MVKWKNTQVIISLAIFIEYRPLLFAKKLTLTVMKTANNIKKLPVYINVLTGNCDLRFSTRIFMKNFIRM